MDARKTRQEYPAWVKLSLWGLPNRGAVWAFFWLSSACAVACVAYGLWRDPRVLVGAFFFGAALMYWLAIRWVDRHGTW